MKNLFSGLTMKEVKLALIIAVTFFLVLPLFITEGWISLVIEILILSLAATGLNLMLGYAGMVSFGPAGFYAVGAYTTALVLMKTKLPFVLAFVSGPILTALLAVFIGWFCVRLTHVYFALLTLAFSQIIFTIIHGWYSFTKGDDGIVGVPIPDFLSSIYNFYYFNLIIIAGCIWFLWRIIKSPFGKTLQAIRENPQRALSVGINVHRYQLATFVLSGLFLGVAGTLFCTFSKNVFPNYAHWLKSTEMLVVCLLGGINVFWGPFVGSFIYQFLDNFISGYTLYWPLVLGTTIILLLLFLRGGIAGYVANRISLKHKTNKQVN